MSNIPESEFSKKLNLYELIIKQNREIFDLRVENKCLENLLDLERKMNKFDRMWFPRVKKILGGS